MVPSAAPSPSFEFAGHVALRLVALPAGAREMSSASSASGRLRILCLHSFKLSGDAMRRQMTQFSNLQDSIADLADLSYLDGGHRLSDDAIPVRSSLLSSHRL